MTSTEVILNQICNDWIKYIHTVESLLEFLELINSYINFFGT